MTVAEDVGRIAAAAATLVGPGEEVAGVLATETLGRRVYLCAFASAEGHSWLALDDDGQPLTERRLELALGESGTSPFASAMQAAMAAVEGLSDDIERNYKTQLA